jgi:pimeloyl-ACP methyl ester carboxylesterase
LAVLEVIQDAGHLPQEEQPTHFTRIVLDWLIPPPAPADSLR